MADITKKCPRCQAELEIPEELIGQVLKCPDCAQQFKIGNPIQLPETQKGNKNVCWINNRVLIVLTSALAVIIVLSFLIPIASILLSVFMTFGLLFPNTKSFFYKYINLNYSHDFLNVLCIIIFCSFYIFTIVISTKNIIKQREIKEMRSVYIANSKVARFVSQANDLAKSGNFNQAKTKIEQVFLIPKATEMEQAEQLMRFLELATNESRLKYIVITLPDKEFNLLLEKNIMPSTLVSGIDALDKRISDSAKNIAVNRERAEERRKEQKRTEQRLPHYTVLDTVNLYQGGTHKDILIPSLSRSTPYRERIRIAFEIKEKEILKTVALFSTHDAFKAGYSASYAEQHPSATNGFLGAISPSSGKFYD